MRMTPPLFYGNPDPLIAESWLDATIKALDAIQVSDDATRVILATYQMRDAADLWWKSVRNTKNVVGMTWKVFQELFLDHYFPEAVKDRFRREFADLLQLNMTVAEY